MAPGPEYILDPHVENAIGCLLLALLVAIIAWALGLPEKRR